MGTRRTAGWGGPDGRSVPDWQFARWFGQSVFVSDGAGAPGLKVSVVGSGLGGCAAAMAMADIGAEVSVFESALAPRREGEGIGLLPPGTAALAALGVKDIPGRRVENAVFLHQSGRRLFTIDAARLERHHGFPYMLIGRGELLELLESRLDGRITYGKRCVGASNTESGAEVRFEDGTALGADLVILADGANSSLRTALWSEKERELFSVVWQGIAAQPASFPSEGTEFLMLGANALVGCFPNGGGEAAWFIEERTQDPEAVNLSLDQLRNRFGMWPEPLPTLLAATERAVRSDRVYLRRPPRDWGHGRILLAGDAAHSLSPSLGQGATQAFTDAVALAEAVETSSSLEQVVGAYRRRRARRANLMWRMAESNTEPRTVAMYNLLGRGLSDRMATLMWIPYTRPDPVVRRKLQPTG